MTDRRKSIFDWNHISDKLTEDQIKELKAYYHTYHRKCWAYKQAARRLKRWKLLGNSLSIIFASGGSASAIAMSDLWKYLIYLIKNPNYFFLILKGNLNPVFATQKIDFVV